MSVRLSIRIFLGENKTVMSASKNNVKSHTKTETIFAVLMPKSFLSENANAYSSKAKTIKLRILVKPYTLQPRFKADKTFCRLSNKIGLLSKK